MTHLGTRISALADGQLPPASTERALSHVAGCPQCAAELAAARAARRALTSVQDAVPGSDLTARLLSLSCPTRPGTPSAADPFVPPSSYGARRAAERDPGRAVAADAGDSRRTGHGLIGRGVLAGAAAAAPWARPALLGSQHALTGDLAPRHRTLRVAAGSLAGLSAVAVALFVLGDRPVVEPATHPAQAVALLGSAASLTDRAAAGSGRSSGASGRSTASTGDVPAMTTSEYLTWLRSGGWLCPSEVPDGWQVTGVRLRDDGDTVEVDVSSAAGDLVVTEQRGRLATEAVEGSDTVAVAGKTVYLISTSPWHAVWQSGDTVVEVVSAGEPADVQTVVAQFPGSDFDPGVTARLTRGWDTLTAAVLHP